MESVTGASVGHGVQSRKEWRAITDNQSLQNTADKNLEHSKFDMDDRRLYEALHGLNCSHVPVDGALDNGDLLQQQLHSVISQREKLQQVEIALRAQVIAGSEITAMQNSYDNQIKEHLDASSKLQEELLAREHKINELERKMEEKEIELHDTKLANEAAWTKENILREQNKELATYRREHDISEADRAHYLSQIHDLQQHIQEKERQFLELQEQNESAKETILYKDEQLREAQTWISRVQERDALHSTTNQSLQSELRECTEQYSRLWLGCQRQFADMERIHLHAIQQFQLELSDARDRSVVYRDESRVTQQSSKDVTKFGQSDGHQLDPIISGTSNEISDILPNGNANTNTSFVSAVNHLTQANHIPGVAIAPSLLGFLPSGQMTALHPFFMHQQSVPSHIPQSDGRSQPVAGFPSLQHWPNQQGVSESPRVLIHDQFTSSQNEQNSARPDSDFQYEIAANGQSFHPEHLNVHAGHINSTMPTTDEPSEAMDKNCNTTSPKSQQNLHLISSQFHDSLRLNSLEQNTETKNIFKMSNHEVESMDQQPTSATCTAQPHSVEEVKTAEVTINDTVSTGQTNKVTDGKMAEPVSSLLDERSLLACIVRTIPRGSGGGIRISSTLPNRLRKMLAPLHWHDYKKTYGKLDDFVSSHPELFVIEDDFIQLREGAQEMIAATAAVAKVAAAAAATPHFPHSTLLALTPMPQSHRLRKLDANSSNNNGFWVSETNSSENINGHSSSMLQNGKSFQSKGSSRRNCR